MFTCKFRRFLPFVLYVFYFVTYPTCFLHFTSGVFVGQPFVPCAAALFSAFCLHIKMREICASLYMGGIVLDGIYTAALSRSGPTY